MTTGPTLDKPFLLADFISDFSIELISISETWLAPDSPPSLISSITPDGFSFLHAPRLSGHWGGVAFLYRTYLKLSTYSIPSFASFESLAVTFRISSTSFTFLTIYRPT